jgi:pimeloyl-ACP methyl ester carboxylesterase
VESSGLRFDELVIDYSGIPDLRELRARDGSRLYCRDYPAESDLHLVLLHGSGSHSRYLFPLAREISAHDVAQVHTPDLRGHGASPDRRGDIDYIDQLEDDLADLVAEIRTGHPAARIVVGGHSSGGGLALRFAGSRYREECSGFVLLAPFLRHDAPTMRRGAGRSSAGGWASPRLSRIFGLRILNSLGIRALNDRLVIEFNMPERYRDRTETLAYSYRLNAGLAPRDFESDLRAIRVPLLLLVGSDDEAFIAEQYEPCVSSFAPHAQVEIVNGVSHMGIVAGPSAPPRIEEWLSRL